MDNKFAFQGVLGAYSEQAGYLCYGKDSTAVPMMSFSDVINAVRNNTVPFGILPIENTLGGLIGEVVDLLSNCPDILVVAEQQLRVSHNLLAIEGAKLENIKTVYSHPQALSQCRKYFKTKLPNAEITPFFDTAGAALYVSKEQNPNIAAVASVFAQKRYNLIALDSSIETSSANWTRFYAITKIENKNKFPKQEKPDRISFTIHLENKPGTLCNILNIIKDDGHNLTKLESRPIVGEPWTYAFFMEAEIDPKNENSFNVCQNKIEKSCKKFILLGKYKSNH